MEELLRDPTDDEDEEAPPPESKKAKAKRAPQHRNLCFTINAQEGVELRLLDMVHPTWTNVRYCIYQREMQEHEHFQGYIEFTSPKTMSAVHAMEGMDRAHLEPRFGSAKQAQHYCMKPVAGCLCKHCLDEHSHPTQLEGPWEFGQISQQCLDYALRECQMQMDKGMSIKRLALMYFPEWVRFGKSFKEYKRITAEPRMFKPVVILIIGRSGLGKSEFGHKLARYLSPLGEDYYINPEKTTGTMWHDDYDQHEVWFKDECDGSMCRPTFFNGLVDKYPFVVPAHGSAGSHMNAKYMIFCSNYHPKFWWKNRSPDQLKQTMRRIDIILFFDATKCSRKPLPGKFAHVGYGQTINPNTIPPKDKGELDEPEPMDLEDPIFEEDCRGD